MDHCADHVSEFVFLVIFAENELVKKVVFDWGAT